MKGERDDASRPPEGRLPYEKPAVTWEQPLEVQPSLMAGCAKLPGQDAACTATPFS